MKLRKAISIYLQSVKGEISPRTHAWYAGKLKSLKDFLGDREIEEITAHDLRRWRARLLDRTERWVEHPYRTPKEGSLSPHTINGHIRACRRLFRWLNLEGYISDNPALKLNFIRTPDEEPKAATEEDIRRMLRVAKSTSPRDYALLCFLIDTGARAGGVVSLTLDRLDLERRRALVIEKSQKRERARRVFFTTETRQALEEWLAVRPKTECDHVFLGVHGAPLSVSGLYQVLRRLAKKAGIKGRFNPHSLRHAFARRVLQQGADLATLSQLMGHSSVEVTVHYYARWADDELGALHDRYSPLTGLLSSIENSS